MNWAGADNVSALPAGYRGAPCAGTLIATMVKALPPVDARDEPTPAKASARAHARSARLAQRRAARADDIDAEALAEHKTELIKAGRGVDNYVTGLHHIAFICKSKDDFEQYVDNPMLKWYAATGGRLHMQDWAREGLESVMPLDWRYNFDMRPAGMTRAEVRHRFDEIVAFSEVEKFLDTPVKRYSSGMYVRLAFSVAAHLAPDILIVDEIGRAHV